MADKKIKKGVEVLAIGSQGVCRGAPFAGKLFVPGRDQSGELRIPDGQSGNPSFLRRLRSSTCTRKR